MSRHDKRFTILSNSLAQDIITASFMLILLLEKPNVTPVSHCKVESFDVLVMLLLHVLTAAIKTSRCSASGEEPTPQKRRFAGQFAKGYCAKTMALNGRKKLLTLTAPNIGATRPSCKLNYPFKKRVYLGFST